MFAKTCIIGLGLMGASVAQAMRERGLSQQIVAFDTHAATLTQAQRLGVIDTGFTTLAQALTGCDGVVIAVPVGAMAGVLDTLAQALAAGVLPDDCVITDVGSTKAGVVAAAQTVRAAHGIAFGQFVPAHPIAGAEKSGLLARNGQLFVHHQVIVCPTAFSDTAAVAKVTALWQALGAHVSVMDAARHDEVLAHTSHLPHLLAFALVNQLAAHDDNLDIFRYAAGGFRDFSRIAASDPIMWHDIFFANKAALLAGIADYEAQLMRLKHQLLTDDSPALLADLRAARHARRHFGHMLASAQHRNDPTMSQPTQRYCIAPAERFTGTYTVAGDKSISHRAIMLGSLAVGTTTVTGFLEGEDALATLQAFVEMGVHITRDGDKVTIEGVGMHGLKAPAKPLDMGNSGTSTRLLAGILAAQAFDSVLIGDASLSKRPMERVAAPLRQMGASLQTTGEKGTPPISITGGKPLRGIDYAMPMASAQVKSCLLLAGLYAQGSTTVSEPEVTRDHTERMLRAFGYPVEQDGNRITVHGGGTLTACDLAVPADISSAAFFMVAASIAPHGDITLPHVGINPTRTGVIDILRLMGADISLTNTRDVGGEPVADIVVKAAPLQGIEIPQHLVPLAIDEFPALFVAASCAEGETVLRGAAELRVKESDRIAVMADGLQTLGVDCTVLDDGIRITGKGTARHVFGGGDINSHHDHRIAMSFAVASLRASATITIHGTETVNTSFPNFAQLVSQAGLNVRVEQDNA